MMNFISNFGKMDFLILIALIPSFVIGLIVYKKDIVEKEPILLLIKLFVLGILSSGIALLFELYLEKILIFSQKYVIFNIIIKSFIVIAFCEEFIKWSFLYIVCWHKKDFNYTYDAIVYAVFIALGFASIENLIAIISNNNDITIAIQRGIITVPAHAFFGIISGYYFGNAKKFESRKWVHKKKKYIVLSIVMPLVAHGIFDSLLLLSDKISIIFILIFIVYLYYSSVKKIKDVSNERKKITKE